MKSFCSLLFSLGITLGSFAQEASFPKPKLSAGTLQFLWKMENAKADRNGALPEYVYRQNAQNQVFVSSIIQVHHGFEPAKLSRIGAQIGTQAGNIWTVQVPIEKVSEFTRIDGIKHIEMDQPMAPDLDSARRRTRVDSIHRGLGLSQAYSGENVVVGIVDAGFDYSHPTFYDTSYSRYRVKRVWEEKNTSGSPPTGFSYGTEFSDSASILTRDHDITTGTHGTHVGGIAAGSGFGSPGGKYRGMAYGSELVLVAMYPSAAYWLNTGMADMLDGINYTFKYAQSVGKPAVANLSWGCPLGPRDGSSLFSQACDNLTGPGKIFVLSGGNNGQNKIHTSKTFTDTDTALSTFLTYSTGLPTKINQVDVWGDTGKTFCMKFSLYTGNTMIASTQTICLDNQTREIFLVKPNGDTCFITATGVPSEFNQKPHMLLQFRSRISERMCLTVIASSGKVDMWQGIVVETSGYYGTFTKYGAAYPWATEGDVISTCGDLVSTKSALAVAAYSSKVNFVNVSGQALTYTGNTRGKIANFSSFGPTADGRTKPDIAGPGMALASSVSSVDPEYATGGAGYNSVVFNYVSSQNGRTYPYAMAAGTSMSSPSVSGIVALLLQANPTLTPDQVKQLFRETAIVDIFTGAIPANGSNTWGYGKVNAYGALKRLLDPTGIIHPKNSDHLLVYPNPNTGSYSVEYLGTHSEDLTLSILDFSGRVLKTETWSVREGSNLHPVDLQGLPSGVYYTRIQSVKQNTVVRIVRM